MSEEVDTQMPGTANNPSTDASSLNAVEKPTGAAVVSKNNVLVPREHLVSTAVKFLQSSAVASSPLKDKQEFLKKKGLTDEEINEAMYRVQNETVTSPQGVVRNQSENRLRNWSLFVVLFGGALYGCYKFYKEYLVPFLSDEKIASETLSTKLSENTQALSAFGQRIDELQQSCDRNTQKIDELQVTAKRDNSVEIKELKDELLSLKRLLLSRHQFPDTPAVKPVIPAWQLEAAQSTSPPADSSSHSSVEGGAGAPIHSANPPATEASPDEPSLEQNGLSDSDTESMAEQTVIDQSAASPDQSPANGHASGQEETTADASKTRGVVSDAAPQSAFNISDQHSTLRTQHLPHLLRSPRHHLVSPRHHLVSDPAVDDSEVLDIYCWEGLAESCRFVPPLHQTHIRAVTHCTQSSSAYLSPRRKVYRDQQENTQAPVITDNHCQTSIANNHARVIYIPTIGQEVLTLEQVSLYIPNVFFRRCSPVVEFTPFVDILTIHKTLPHLTLYHQCGSLRPQELMVDLLSVQMLEKKWTFVPVVELVVWPILFIQPTHCLTVYINSAASPRIDEAVQIQPELKFSSMQTVSLSCQDFGVVVENVVINPVLKNDFGVQTQSGFMYQSGTQTIKTLYRDFGVLAVEEVNKYDYEAQTQIDDLFFDTCSQTIIPTCQDCGVSVNTLIVEAVDIDDLSTQTEVNSFCVQSSVQTVPAFCQDVGVNVNSISTKDFASQVHVRRRLDNFGVQTTCVLCRDCGTAASILPDASDSTSQTQVEFPLTSFGTQTSQVVRNRRTMVKTRTANRRIQANVNSLRTNSGVQTVLKNFRDYGLVTDIMTVQPSATSTAAIQTQFEFLQRDNGIQTRRVEFEHESGSRSQTVKHSTKSVATTCDRVEVNSESLKEIQSKRTLHNASVQTFVIPVKNCGVTVDVPIIDGNIAKCVGTQIETFPTPWKDPAISTKSLAVQTIERDKAQTGMSVGSAQTTDSRYESCLSLLSDKYVDAPGELLSAEKSTQSLPSKLSSSAVQTFETQPTKIDATIQTIGVKNRAVGIEAIPSVSHKTFQTYSKTHLCSVGHQTVCTLSRNKSIQVGHKAMVLTRSMVAPTERPQEKATSDTADRSTSVEVINVVGYQDSSTLRPLSHQSQQSDCTLCRDVAVLTNWILYDAAVQTLPNDVCSHMHLENSFTNSYTADQSVQTAKVVPLARALSYESHYHMAPERFFSELTLPLESPELSHLDDSNSWRSGRQNDVSLQETSNVIGLHKIPKLVVQSELDLELPTSSLTISINDATIKSIDVRGSIEEIPAIPLSSLTKVNAVTQTGPKPPVYTKSTYTDNGFTPERNACGYQTLINIPPHQRVPHCNTPYQFFANVHGVSKSTLTTQREYSTIAVATHITSSNKTSSTKSIMTTDRDTLTDLIDSNGLSKDSTDCKSSTYGTDVIIQTDVDGTFHAELQPTIVRHSDIRDKATFVETEALELKSESTSSNLAVEDQEPSKTKDNSSFISKLFEKIKELSNKIDIQYSTSDTTVWNRNAFESATSHSICNTDEFKQESSSNLVYYTAVSSFFTDHDAQTEDVDTAIVVEPMISEAEEVGRSLAWEIMESAIIIAENRRLTLDTSLALETRVLQTIVEESESDDDSKKSDSIQCTISVGQVEDGSCRTPPGLKKGETGGEFEPSEDQLLRTRSEVYVGHSSVSISRKSHSANSLDRKENFLYSQSDISDFPTIKLDDFSLQKLQHSLNPRPSGDDSSMPVTKPLETKLSANAVELSPVNAPLPCTSVPSCSFSVFTSETDKAVDNDGTLSDLSHLLDTSSSITTLSTNSIDALLSQSVSELTNSDSTIIC